MSLHSESADWKIYKERTCAGMREFVKKAGTTALQLLYPMATYCVCCGNLIDRSRSYCLCDHCIRRIEWGWLQVDLAAQAAEAGRENYLDSAVACISYGLYGRGLIFDLKYNKHTYMARVIADILADRLCSDPAAQHLLTADFIVPVPLHPKRMAQRGFNQTAKIGKHLERRLREVRTADLTEQEGLSREHVRRKAACADAGAFETEAQRERFGTCEDDVPCASSEVALRKAQAAQGRTAAQKAAFPRLLAGALRRTKATAPQSALSAEERYTNLADAFAAAPAFLPRLAGARVLLLDDVYTTGATANQCAKTLKEAGAAAVHLVALATGNHYASGHFAQ